MSGSGKTKKTRRQGGSSGAGVRSLNPSLEAFKYGNVVEAWDDLRADYLRQIEEFGEIRTTPKWARYYILHCCINIGRILEGCDFRKDNSDKINEIRDDKLSYKDKISLVPYAFGFLQSGKYNAFEEFDSNNMKMMRAFLADTENSALEKENIYRVADRFNLKFDGAKKSILEGRALIYRRKIVQERRAKSEK